MTRFFAMRVRLGAVRSRRLPAEALAGKLADQAAELQREERLERLGRGQPGAPDHVVHVFSLGADAREDPPLVSAERRLGGGRARRRQTGDEPGPELGEDVLHAGDERGALLDQPVRPPVARPERPRHAVSAPRCAAASMPAARPLTTVTPAPASSRPSSSATRRPYSLARRAPTTATARSSSATSVPRTARTTGGSEIWRSRGG